MRLDRLKEMKKTEVRPYFQSLAGITPYVEAAVAVDCFGVAAAPVDTKLLLWLVSKDALPEGMDMKTAQQIIEKHLKATEAEEFFHGARKEIDDWSPKSGRRWRRCILRFLRRLRSRERRRPRRPKPPPHANARKNSPKNSQEKRNR